MDSLQEPPVLLTADADACALVPILSVCDGSCVSQYFSDPCGSDKSGIEQHRTKASTSVTNWFSENDGSRAAKVGDGCSDSTREAGPP